MTESPVLETIAMHSPVEKARRARDIARDVTAFSDERATPPGLGSLATAIELLSDAVLALAHEDRKRRDRLQRA